MEFLRCQICGDVFIGVTRPSNCPFCGAKGRYMVPADKWTDENLSIDILSELSRKNLEHTLMLEVTNAAFYRDSSAKAKTALLQGVFKGLGKVEAEHASVVTKILKCGPPQLAPGMGVASDDDNENLYLAHMMEKEAARLYDQFAAEAVEPRVKKVFNALSEIESDHIGIEEGLMGRLSCFKAYDVRGRFPDEIDEALAYRIGRAFSEVVSKGAVVIGRDVRLSSRAIAESLARGLMDSGHDVLDIGLCGTEQVYFSTSHLGAAGGIMVTASHNPPDYNGMKFVREGSRPISGDTGLREIEALSANGRFRAAAARGGSEKIDTSLAYAEHILGYVDAAALKPFTVCVNPGNGCAGPIIDMLGARLPFKFIKLSFTPDGSFPNGVPNPLLPENREVTSRAVIESGADIGVAWDGDFDRCFFFDETGRFIEGYYIVGLLAEAVLAHNPGGKIIHDPRLTWNTIDLVRAAGGIPVMSKTGHAFIKERMRAEDAVYGGEMSAHHYFRDFAYCDSGMIPWLLVTELMSRTGKKLSQLVEERERRYPASGEINFRIDNPAAALKKVEQHFTPGALSIDHTDGVSIEFADWRFNLRMSNTEPLVRLNVEARGDRQLMEGKTKEILSLLS
jgi:phosphomannomutase/rubrerythrin